MPGGILTDNARKILEVRYKDKKDRDIDSIWKRCSLDNDDYYRLLSGLYGLPNSPTLFNLGTGNGGTLSACFVFDVADTLYGNVYPAPEMPWDDSIIGTLYKASSVAKAGGGVGYFFGNIRPKGSEVKSVHRKSCGPVEVLRFYHRLRSLITQGGKRDLAQMGVLQRKHPDIREWIHAKDADPKSLESFNISVDWYSDSIRNIDWDVLQKELPDLSKTNEDTELWWDQCSSAWGTGCPGMLFGDIVNLANATPHLGRVNATNPCGETPNLSDEPCNLGSLALFRFLVRNKSGKWVIDYGMLEQFVRLMTRYLDDVLDANQFPHPAIDKAARLTRKLGLGCMGWADLLAYLKIPYDTRDAVDLGRELWGKVNQWALDESINLSKSKGCYPAWETASEETKKRFPYSRNSTRTSIAPTGTIALIAGCGSWSIEPHYALENTRTTNEGIKMIEKIPFTKDWDGFVPKTANEIALEWHVRHQAAFQANTDLGVSKTINMPNSATKKDVSDAYRMMHDLGCKGGTIYRDGCRPEQVLVDTKKKASVYTTGLDVPKTTTKLPNRRTGDTTEFKIGNTKGFVTINAVENSPKEVFLVVAKGGTTIRGMMDSWAMILSKALQEGVPVEKLVKLHSGTRFEPSGPTGCPEVPVCTSIPDFVVRLLEKRYAPKTEMKVDSATTFSVAVLSPKTESGMLCPECGTEMVMAEGCYNCPSPGCGYSKCG